MTTWTRIAARYFLAFLAALMAVLALFSPHPFPGAIVWAFLAAHWAYTAIVRQRVVIAHSETMHIESPRPDPGHIEPDWDVLYPIRTHAEALDLPRFPQAVRGDFEPEVGRPVYRMPNVSEDEARAILERHGFAWGGPIAVVPPSPQIPRVAPPTSPSPGPGYAWNGARWVAPWEGRETDAVTP